MNTSMRYITVEESEMLKKLAERYNIKGYSASTSLMCSPSPTQFQLTTGRSKTVTKAKKRAAKKR